MKTLMTCASAVALLAGIGPAQAEEITAKPTTVLEEVIVTATRRTENLQRAPVAISSVSADTLKSQGVTQPQDLNKIVPGLSLSPQGTNTQVYVRGVGTYTVAAYADSAVAFNVDGVFLAFPGEIAGNFFDLARVEVLKGPQGTLYGRNASAGAINLITNRPEFSFGGDVMLEVGDYNLRRFEGAANLPLSDNLAARVAGQIISRDGYFSDGTGDAKSEAARIQVLYKPSSALSILAAADYSHSDDHGSPFVPMPTADASDPWLGPSTAKANKDLIAARTSGVPMLGLPPGIPFPLLDTTQFSKNEVWGAHAEVIWDLGVGATLTVLPSYRHMSSDSLVQPGFFAGATTESNESSLEARLSGKINALNWILGAYYFDSSINTFGYTLQGVATQSFNTDQDVSSYAFFSDFVYDITERLKFLGGIRYTSEDREQAGRAQIAQFPLLPFTYMMPGSATFEDVSGRLGVSYDLTDSSLLFASASNGFKAGGFNADRAPNSYEPEKLTSYTIGSKNRFLEGKLQANFEMFYWDYKDHQENILSPLNAGGFSPQIRNIGQSSLKGVNADVQFLATSDDLFSLQVEYLDATFDTYKFFTPVAPIPGVTLNCPATILPPIGPGAPPSANVDCSGKPFTRAPKLSGVAGYQHTFRLDSGAAVIASINTQFASSSYVATDYIPNERQGSYTMSDISLGYEAPEKKWSLVANVRNLENEAVYTGAFEHPFLPGKVFGTLRPPRTYSVVLRSRF